LAADWVTVSPPSVNFIFASSNLLLSWPANAAGFSLQETINISDPDAWTLVSATFVIGDQNGAIIIPTGPSTFFRLKQ
jgi:hypothetical protein